MSKKLKISTYSEDHGNFINLNDIVFFFAKHINIFIFNIILIGSISILYAQFIAEYQYTSTAKIMSTSSSGQSQIAGLASEFGISLPTNQSEPKWVYDDIIKSRTLSRAILKREFFSSRFNKHLPIINILNNKEKINKENLYNIEFKTIGKLIDMLSLSQNIKTGVYTLSITSSDRKLSQYLVNAFIEELDLHQRNYNKMITGEAREFIEKRIETTKNELNLAEENLKDFAIRNRRIENSPLLLLEQQRLTREVSVLIGVFTTLKQQLETTKIEELKESNYVIVVDPPELPLIRSSPKKKAIVIYAMVFAFLLAVGIGLVKEFLDSTTNTERKKFSVAKELFVRNLFSIIKK